MSSKKCELHPAIVFMSLPGWVCATCQPTHYGSLTRKQFKARFGKKFETFEKEVEAYETARDGGK